jgi:DNA-binding NarL/FixJ family response regulator
MTPPLETTMRLHAPARIARKAGHPSGQAGAGAFSAAADLPVQPGRRSLTTRRGAPHSTIIMAPNPALLLSLAGGPLRVHIVTPDPLVKVALEHAVELRQDVGVVELDQADLVLWDGGAELDAIAPRLPEIAAFPAPVVVLLPDERWARAALAAGARGALLRSADGPSLLAALIAARHGLTVLDTGFALPEARPLGAAAGAELTRREGEVLALLADGLSNKEIAQRLTISDHTAKFHVNGILGKLGAQSRTEAVVLAARSGLLTL